MKTINPESRTPLFLQMKEILKERFLSDGTYSGRLPSAFEIAAEYNVNQMVVQRATRQLCDEGYLNRRPKIGTFVSQKKTKTIRIGYYELPAYSTKKILSLFAKSCPDIIVEQVNLDSHRYVDKLSDMLHNDEVDVVKVSESVFRGLDAPALFHSLNGYAREAKDRGTYLKPWNAFKYLKTCYAVPMAFSPVVMVYNKDLFDKSGVGYPDPEWNWNDFLAKAKKLTVLNGDGRKDNEQYGFLFSSHFNRWPVFVFQNNGRLLDEGEKTLALSNAASREAIQFMMDLIYKWKVAPVLVDLGELSDTPFLRSKIAMAMTSYYHFGMLNETAGFSWDIAPLPQNRRKATLLLADGFAVSRKARNYEACVRFLTFTQSDVVQKYIKRCGSVVPVNRHIAERRHAGAPANYGIFNQILKHADFLKLPHVDDPRMHIVKGETELMWHGLQGYEEMCRHVEVRLEGLRARKTKTHAALRSDHAHPDTSFSGLPGEGRLSPSPPCS